MRRPAGHVVHSVVRKRPAGSIGGASRGIGGSPGSSTAAKKRPAGHVVHSVVRKRPAGNIGGAPPRIGGASPGSIRAARKRPARINDSLPPTELDDEETLTLQSNPSPVGPQPTDSSPEPEPTPAVVSSPWAAVTPAYDRPVVPNIYHGEPATLRDADAVWWHEDTLCVLTLDATVYLLFWDHARLGTPRWWHQGPRTKAPYDTRGMTVVMRRWTGPAGWAPLNTVGEVMEVTRVL